MMRGWRAGKVVLGALLTAGISLGTIGSWSPAAGAAKPESFTGSWVVHDGALSITSVHKGVLRAFLGSCGANADQCVETDALSLSLSKNKKTMLAKVTKVTITAYTPSGQVDKTSVPAVSMPDQVGDSFRLRFAAPHLLVRTIVKGMSGWVGGNPYWCGPGLAQRYQQDCGA
jgi:hypothetical protein